MLEHSCMFRFTISYLRFPNATGKRLLVGHFYIGQMFLGDSSEQLQCGAGLLIRQRWAYQILPSHVSLNLFSIPGMLWSLLISAFVQWANRLVINPLPHERQHLASLAAGAAVSVCEAGEERDGESLGSSRLSHDRIPKWFLMRLSVQLRRGVCFLCQDPWPQTLSLSISIYWYRTAFTAAACFSVRLKLGLVLDFWTISY